MTYIEHSVIKKMAKEGIGLLKHLIATPSISREEKEAADIIEQFIQSNGMDTWRWGNNVWTMTNVIDRSKPTLLLNAHIDTVKPTSKWSRDPYSPTEEGDRLYGLGSNDCGGGLVSLIQTFRLLKDEDLAYNLVFLASAEEEISGKNGISSVLQMLPEIDAAIVGEPTGLQPAIAEKGLMVVDCKAHGKSGHAAREEGVNALYEAIDDINFIRQHKFKKVSQLLGPTKMTVTIANAGTQHNVIPDTCDFTIDIRTNEYYKNEFVFNFLQKKLKSKIKARSFRLSSSSIPEDHPLVKRCLELGMKPFGSPTLSDQALMPWPSMKLGPGESARSHTADEYICYSEIEKAIETYLSIICQANSQD